MDQHLKSQIVSCLISLFGFTCKVDVIGEDNIVFKTFKEGDFFGEESLLGNPTRKYCTRTVTHVDLFCLRSVDLVSAFQSFPEEEERVLAFASK